MNNQSSGFAPIAPFPFLRVLCLIFITLKLCGVIAWSWFWVLSPMLAALIIHCANTKYLQRKKKLEERNEQPKI